MQLANVVSTAPVENCHILRQSLSHRLSGMLQLVSEMFLVAAKHRKVFLCLGFLNRMVGPGLGFSTLSVEVFEDFIV